MTCKCFQLFRCELNSSRKKKKKTIKFYKVTSFKQGNRKISKSCFIEVEAFSQPLLIYINIKLFTCTLSRDD